MSRLQELLQKADSYKEKMSAFPPLEEQQVLEKHLSIDFTYTSNGLSGNNLSLRETELLLKDGVVSGSRTLKEYCEAAGHDVACHFMLTLARQKDMSMTEDMIKKLHWLFYQKVDADQAGRYRLEQAYLSGTAYIPPAAEDIPRLMGHLADQTMSSRTTLHPVELAAMVHKRLLDIHPFTDGNGRIARLLMNLILIQTGYGMVSIPPERYDDYITALTESRKQSDMEPFSKLIAECVIEAGRDYCRLLMG